MRRRSGIAVGLVLLGVVAIGAVPPGAGAAVTAGVEGWPAGAPEVKAPVDLAGLALAGEPEPVTVARHAMAAAPVPARSTLTARQADGPVSASQAECVEVPLVNRCPTWVATHDNPEWQTEGSWADIAIAAVMSPSGDRVYVTGDVWDNRSGGYMGCCPPPGGFDVGTVALDPTTGETLWSTRYDGPDSLWDLASAIAVSPDGASVYVVGIQNQTVIIRDGSQYLVGDYMTLAYDAATGALRWSAAYRVDQELQYSRAWGLTVSPDGRRVYVTGESGDVPGGRDGEDRDVATVAYDAETGEEVWVARHTSAPYWVTPTYSVSHDAGLSVQPSPDGRVVYVAGWRHGGDAANHYEYVTIAYDADEDPESQGEGRAGDELWVATYDAGETGASTARVLRVSPDGDRVYVTGEQDWRFDCVVLVCGTPQDSQYGTLAYDAATGEQLWAAVHVGVRAPTGRTSRPLSMELAPDGSRVFVTGRDSGSDGHRFGTVAYETAAGELLWSAAYQAPGRTTNYGQALAVAPDGSAVYTVGSSSTGAARADVTVAAHDTDTGAVAWQATYNHTGVGIDGARDVVVTPDGGGVVVVGSFDNPQLPGAPDAHNAGDYGVLRYER